MWNTDSLWLEVAIVTSLTAVGTIFFGHFEEQTPKWRKVVKLIFFVFVTTLISATAGRIWAMSFLGAMLLFVVYIHAIGFPERVLMAGRGSRAISTMNYEAGKRKRNR